MRILICRCLHNVHPELEACLSAEPTTEMTFPIAWLKHCKGTVTNCSAYKLWQPSHDACFQIHLAQQSRPQHCPSTIVFACCRPLGPSLCKGTNLQVPSHEAGVHAESTQRAKPEAKRPKTINATLAWLAYCVCGERSQSKAGAGRYGVSR